MCLLIHVKAILEQNKRCVQNGTLPVSSIMNVSISRKNEFSSASRSTSPSQIARAGGITLRIGLEDAA
jgi:hypothetical protein